MADYAPNYTPRYRMRYHVLGRPHTQVWRLPLSTTDPAAMIAKIGLWLTDLSPLLSDDFTVVAGDFALQDSDVFLPAGVPSFTAGEVGPGTFVSNDDVWSISFVGRSIAGQKARMFLYGTSVGVTVRSGLEFDFRITSSENGAISDAIVRMNETSPPIVGSDGENVVWYEYVNVKANDYWVRRTRAGA